MDIKNNIIGYIHFDRPGLKSYESEALVKSEKVSSLLRNKFVKISNQKENGGKTFLGRIIEGPFFSPQEVNRDSSLAEVAILEGEMFPSTPNFYALIKIEILGEIFGNTIKTTGTRPGPRAIVGSLSSKEIEEILELDQGDMVIGNLEGYDEVFVKLDSKVNRVLPRNVGIFGTVGSGKTNTAQVLIEEASSAGWAVVIIDVEGEYTAMDSPNPDPNAKSLLEPFSKEPVGIPKENFNVYKLAGSDSTRVDRDEREVTIFIREIAEEESMLSEIIEATEAQSSALALLINRVSGKNITEEKDPFRKTGYIKRPYVIQDLIDEIANILKSKRNKEEGENEQMGDISAISFRPLRRKLTMLKNTGAFDAPATNPINATTLLKPGKVSAFDVSQIGDVEKNLLIATLLTKIYDVKRNESGTVVPILLMIEEAHTFISKDNVDKMKETLTKVKEIARRGRKRWMSLCFISQQPSHLPMEIFELTNTRIVHKVRSEQNLNMLKVTSGNVTDQMWDSLPGFGTGQAILDSTQFPNPMVIHSRICKTKRHFDNPRRV